MQAFEEDGTTHHGELVIGFVAPTGVDLDSTLTAIEACLSSYEYVSRRYRLSSFFDLKRVSSRISPVDKSSEYARIETSMRAGNELRAMTGRNEIMALYTIGRIHQDRLMEGGREPNPLNRTAFLLRSLKRPEEVISLRRTYGSRFLLISIFVPREERIRNLQSRDEGMTEVQAVELVSRDEQDDDRESGQATSKTFQLADLFLDGTRGEEGIKEELHRFFDLVFGSPRVTPNKDEHLMFLAFAASLRSGDLSRQVGAVVATSDGAVVSEGANDAPRYGGGQYWPGRGDQRDIVKGFDSNERVKRQMARSILKAFGALEEGQDPLETAKSKLKDTGLFDITEFGRAVHAEMAALSNCARLGVSTRGTTLYCTTFPCHNCAKHIVAAGVEEVVFIEPYPKSRALELHGDSVSFGATKERVELRAFVGIGPKRYIELFSLQDIFGNAVKRKDGAGRLAHWSRKGARPALTNQLVTYIEREKQALSALDDADLEASDGT